MLFNQNSKHFKSSEEFRTWLKKHYDKSTILWLIFYKKHTGIKNISYDEAVEEALCYGWIDSTKKRIDDEKYAWKFTPRSNTKNWSDTNKIRVNKLIKEGRMTEAGLNKIDLYLKTGKIDWEVIPKHKKIRDEVQTPEFIIEFISKNEAALYHFNQLAPSHKRNYIAWITQAKKPETIKKRLAEAIKLLKKNKKLGLK